MTLQLMGVSLRGHRDPFPVTEEELAGSGSLVLRKMVLSGRGTVARHEGMVQGRRPLLQNQNRSPAIRLFQCVRPISVYSYPA
jgi:hypothetical protein